MIGATAAEDGAAGLVPAPEKGDKDRYLRSDGMWTPADGGDADLVDGFHASRENVADTCVVRAADGGVQVGAIISDTPKDENPAVSQILVTNGADDTYRRASLQHLKNSMGIGGYTWGSLYIREGITDI